MKVKITQAGWEGYTGELGMAVFKDGVSESVLPQRMWDMLAGTVSLVEIDEEGNEMPIGASHRLVGGATIPAEVLEPLQVQSEAEKKAELKANKGDGKPKGPPVDRFYKFEDLEKIADEKGLKGLREIGDKWKVRERNIQNLIALILKAQQDYLDSLAGKERVHQPTVDPLQHVADALNETLQAPGALKIEPVEEPATPEKEGEEVKVFAPPVDPLAAQMSQQADPASEPAQPEQPAEQEGAAA